MECPYSGFMYTKRKKNGEDVPRATSRHRVVLTTHGLNVLVFKITKVLSFPQSIILILVVLINIVYKILKGEKNGSI